MVWLLALSGRWQFSGKPSPNATRLLLTAVVLLAAVAALSHTGVTFTNAPEERASFSSASVELSDDDAGSAMFNVSNMAPGKSASNCITVSYRGPAPTTVKLYGTSAGSGLDRALDLVVEAGAGGRFNDCTGFSGTLLYTGTLAGFTATHAAAPSALSAFAAASSTDTRTFRFTFALQDDPAAQGAAAAATFTWLAQDLGSGTVTVPPRPAPSATPTPTAPSPGAPAPRASVPPATGTAPLGHSPETAPPAGDAGGPGAVTAGASRSPAPGRVPTAGEAPASSLAPPPAVEASGPAPSGPAVRPRPHRPDRKRAQGEGGVLGTAQRLATVAAKRSTFPLLLLVIVVVFLVVQDQIDRKDPKLALAPVYAEPDLDFQPPPSREGDER